MPSEASTLSLLATTTVVLSAWVTLPFAVSSSEFALTLPTWRPLALAILTSALPVPMPLTVRVLSAAKSALAILIVLSPVRVTVPTALTVFSSEAVMLFVVAAESARLPAASTLPSLRSCPALLTVTSLPSTATTPLRAFPALPRSTSYLVLPSLAAIVVVVSTVAAPVWATAPFAVTSSLLAVITPRLTSSLSLMLTS